jgi:hypothetical protein
MRSHSAWGTGWPELGVMLAGAGFQSRSLSAAGQAGRRMDGLGVRLLGYLFVDLRDVGEGMGANHLSGCFAGDWLCENRGALEFALAKAVG